MSVDAVLYLNNHQGSSASLSDVKDSTTIGEIRQDSDGPYMLLYKTGDKRRAC